ncbi:MAG: tRNA/rRNA methyltransferase [Proteobacteria bacterium]|nr:MAG: tRNA/rRNA methyltransferase [Pseudomonadota bacterium]
MSKKIIPRNQVKTAQVPELLFYGLHICEKLGDRRRSDIIRVYCTEEVMPSFKPLLQWCAGNRKAYHIVTAKELEKITGSVHHEGVAILARQAPYASLRDLEQLLSKHSGPVPLLYLDGVQNPHNIGTIMRVMASFGWPYVVGPKTMAPMSAAAARMSEGGAEFVEVFAAESGSQFIDWAKNLGYKIFGTSSHEATSLYKTSLPDRVVIVLGHEVHGMSKEVDRKLDQRIAIPTTGQVESLNVAAATGILVGEYTRQHKLVSGPLR